MTQVVYTSWSKIYDLNHTTVSIMHISVHSHMLEEVHEILFRLFENLRYSRPKNVVGNGILSQ